MTILIGCLLVCCFACQEKTIGYLITEKAGYEPDSLIIPSTLDPEKDAIRIENKAPWMTFSLQVRGATYYFYDRVGDFYGRGGASRFV
ncbi:MAG: hypothetical protein ACLU4N_08405 [Butyricimonas faecihominis]